MLPRHWDAGWVDLREAGVGKGGPTFVRAPDGRDVTPFGIGRQIIRVAVATRREHHRIGSMGGDLPGHEIARHDSARLAIDDHQVEHFGTRVHLHLAETDLAC
jgi:hypothetical protein